MYHHDERDITDYLQRMKASRQFKMIGVEPVWAPGTGDIDGFIHDEVVRQFHDPRVERDGGVRIKWMRAAWDYARERSAEGLPLDMDFILRLGATVEPHVNSTIGFRTMNVYIGDDMGAPPGLLPTLMTTLVSKASQVEPAQGNPGPSARDYRKLWAANLRDEGYHPGHTVLLDRFSKLADDIQTADDFYLAYEACHPFSDGNGRSGKIIHNLLLGSLDEPILVGNYFGENP